MNDAIRVLIVDDHLVVRLGICVLLATEPDILVVGEAGSEGMTAQWQTRLQSQPTGNLKQQWYPDFSG